MCYNSARAEDAGLRHLLKKVKGLQAACLSDGRLHEEVR